MSILPSIHLCTLPMDILFHILDCLPIQSITHLSRTCTIFSTNIDNHYWKRLYESEWSPYDIMVSPVTGNWKQNYAKKLKMESLWASGRYSYRKTTWGTVTRVKNLGPYFLAAICEGEYGDLVVLDEAEKQISRLRVHSGLIWWYTLVDNDLCVSCGNEGAVSVTDINGITLTQRYKVQLQERALWSVDVDKKEDVIVAGSSSQDLYVLKLSTGEIKHHLQIVSGFYDITLLGGLAFACPTHSPDLLVIDYQSGTLTEWKSPREKAFINAIRPGLPSSTEIITADSQGGVTGFDCHTHACLWTLTASTDNGVSDVVVFRNKIYAAVNVGGVAKNDMMDPSSYVRVWDYGLKKHLYDITITNGFISRIYAMDVGLERIVIGGGNWVYLVQLMKEEDEKKSESVCSVC